MEMLLSANSDFSRRAISPFAELGAYEALWERTKASFKTIAEKFSASENALPSDFIDSKTAITYANDVHKRFKDSGISTYGVRVHGDGEYPQKLRDANYPLELVYYQGWWDLVNSPRSIAVVGSRNATPEGLSRTRKLVKALLSDDFTIVSGLAKGVDTMALTTAISEGGRTIAVIGTPLNHFYPAENAKLQKEIAANHLLISQVPVKRYENQPNPKANRFFFPERNITMSALTDATIIVEASDTSGTLHQATAALQQGRKLFILDSCFKREDITWPRKFEERGAIRVSDYNDIRQHLLSSDTAE